MYLKDTYTTFSLLSLHYIYTGVYLPSYYYTNFVCENLTANNHKPLYKGSTNVGGNNKRRSHFEIANK